MIVALCSLAAVCAAQILALYAAYREHLKERARTAHAWGVAEHWCNVACGAAFDHGRAEATETPLLEQAKRRVRFLAARLAAHGDDS